MLQPILVGGGTGMEWLVLGVFSAALLTRLFI